LVEGLVEVLQVEEVVEGFPYVWSFAVFGAGDFDVFAVALDDAGEDQFGWR
jgi:hypothetical protein